jgi:hypothetical protein
MRSLFILRFAIVTHIKETKIGRTGRCQLVRLPSRIMDAFQIAAEDGDCAMY